MGLRNQSKSENTTTMGFVDVRLIPFYTSIGVYYFLYQPYLHRPPETVDAAIVKAIPIWCLALVVHGAGTAFKATCGRTFTAGLLLSSLGDMCLVWRVHLFIPGMVCFAVAHVFYLWGLSRDFNFHKTRMLFLFIVIHIGLYVFIATGIESLLMLILVFIYQSLLIGVAWLSLERYIVRTNSSSLMAASGSVLFVLSDFLIAVDKWKFTLPLSSMSIMTSYYAAQLCLALAAVQNG